MKTKINTIETFDFAKSLASKNPSEKLNNEFLEVYKTGKTTREINKVVKLSHQIIQIEINRINEKAKDLEDKAIHIVQGLNKFLNNMKANQLAFDRMIEDYGSIEYRGESLDGEQFIGLINKTNEEWITIINEGRKIYQNI